MPNGRNSRALLPPSLCVSYTQTGALRPIDPHQVQVEPLAAGNLCSSIRAKQSRFTYIVSSSRYAGLLVHLMAGCFMLLGLTSGEWHIPPFSTAEISPPFPARMAGG